MGHPLPIYFATPSTLKVRECMSTGRIGCIDTPRQDKFVPNGATWVADNSCYGTHYPGDTKWGYWLSKKARQADVTKCMFATIPDVVGDAKGTLERFLPLAAVPKQYGYPVAYVAQDGVTSHPPPWDLFDVLFIGGTNDFKLGEEGRVIIHQAHSMGKLVHMGRVNSFKRLKYAYTQKCHSVDGTFLAFGPDMNLPILLKWISKLEAYVTEQDSLFT